MSRTYSVYCDESCHLENDRQQVMVLGAVWCPLERRHEIAQRLKGIKERNGLSSDFEIKWTKVSPAKEQFYLEILDYFFEEDDLHFRALVVPDKEKLRQLLQPHDDCYYEMYFTMLKDILSPEDSYRIYLDIKDTRSASKLKLLRDVLREHIQDQDQRIIEWLQTVRSHEISIMQVTDLLIGAVGYANRKITTSTAKNAFIARFRERSQYELNRSTLPREEKTNILIWQAKEGE